MFGTTHTTPTARQTMLSRKQLAKALGVSERQISYYVDRGMPQLSRGRYALEACQAWRESSIKGGPNSEERAQWEAHKVHYEALSAQLKYRQLAGELIDLDVAAREAERRITHARALLEQLPDRLLGLLPARSLKGADRKRLRLRLAETIDDTLEALAAKIEETKDDDDRGSGPKD